MKSFNILIAAALLASLSTACSSDDKKTSSGGGKASCDAYCAKIESSCGDAGIEMQVAFCQIGCVAIPVAGATCDPAAQTYFDCLQKQSNVCAEGCTTEKTQYDKACGGETDAG